MLLRGAGFSFDWLDSTVQRADLSAALREVASDPRFREAVTWQNRAAVDDGLDSLLRKPADATDAKTRKKELLVVRYLQRYCAKNDTIGFFGPVGWAQWGSGGRFETPRELLSARRTFAEPWMARALADALAADPSLRDEAWVWLPGDLRVSGRKLIAPSQTYALKADEAALLSKLQAGGAKKARALIGRSAARRELLERLASQSMVRWTFPVAISHQPLAALPRCAPVELVRAAIDALPTGDASGLGEGLRTLEAAFSDATAQAPKRHEGKTYGGRGLVYEECRRAGELTLSAAMRKRVERPLTVLLSVARWYSFQIARGLARRLDKAHERKVPLHVFWADTAKAFAGEAPPVVMPVVAQLRKKWNALFAGRASIEIEEAEALAARLFAAPCPGWPGARHHAPDLMWHAPSAEEMLRGEGTPVLGELHPGVTPFTTLSVLAHAPDLPALEQQWREDLGEGGITPIPWEDFARSSHDARLSPKHWHLDIGYEFESGRPAKQVLRAADFDVIRRGGRLVAVHRTRALSFDLLQVFERRVKMIAASHFSLSDGDYFGPRRTLGDLVVQRAHWRFDQDQLSFLDDAEGRAERVAAFLSQHRLPRRVFVRSPNEVKPIYLDWEAPILVELVARLARQADWLSMSEMLPGPDGLWLRDGNGGRYVCELRCVAVDPRAFEPAAIWPRAVAPVRSNRR